MNKLEYTTGPRNKFYLVMTILNGIFVVTGYNNPEPNLFTTLLLSFFFGSFATLWLESNKIYVQVDEVDESEQKGAEVLPEGEGS